MLPYRPVRSLSWLALPFRAALGRLLLPGICCSKGLPEYIQQPVHHWHFLYSNPRTNRKVDLFLQLTLISFWLYFLFLKNPDVVIQKIIETCNYRWHCGQ